MIKAPEKRKRKVYMKRRWKMQQPSLLRKCEQVGVSLLSCSRAGLRTQNNCLQYRNNSFNNILLVLHLQLKVQSPRTMSTNFLNSITTNQGFVNDIPPFLHALTAQDSPECDRKIYIVRVQHTTNIQPCYVDWQLKIQSLIKQMTIKNARRPNHNDLRVRCQ